MKFKNIFKAIAVAAMPMGMLMGSLSSCSDMLETESSLFVSNPNINNKSDSVFYAYGIMQAMQQLADQYFFQNEMRGELVAPTSKATTHLKNLADYTAGVENKYDSVYLYYKVINNCNYYLQHRDTTLMTGTKNVTINEFVAVAAFRAWAYLQLAKQYGDVPYITSPVSSVSEINAKTEATAYTSILQDQAAYLQNQKNRYSEEYLSVPSYSDQVDIGSYNFANSVHKYINPAKCFLPINVVLGDLYLELGRYEEAAVAYHDYLLAQARKGGVDKVRINYSNMVYDYDLGYMQFPLDYNQAQSLTNGIYGWENMLNGNLETVSYIPMAVNYLKGKTTEVPQAFGYDYYATTLPKGNHYAIFRCPEIGEMQVQPTSDYMSMLKNATYYYLTNKEDPEVSTRYLYSSANLGDGRGNMLVKGDGKDSVNIYTQKPSLGVICLYRTTTVYLRLAEALNRMGEPELAFAILKSGIHEGKDGISEFVDTVYQAENKIPQENYYIPYASYKKLKEGPLDFLSTANVGYFTNSARREICGVHFHGAGAVEDIRSTYTYKSVVEERIDKIRQQYKPELVGSEYTKDEYINAVEDLLCDEYALELAFEGTRFSDLQRIARHKNANSPYGGGFGFVWFTDKLKKNTTKTFASEADWYLPFK